MNISNRTYPVLGFLKEKTISKCTLHSADLYNTNRPAKSEFDKIFKAHIDRFSENIFYITNTLDNSVSASYKKLNTPEIISNTKSQSGIILFKQYQMCFSINNRGEEWDITLLVFFGSDIVSMLYDHSGNEVGIYWNSLLHKNTLLNPDRYKAVLFATLNFLRYAKIETKYLHSTKKCNLNDNKYVNNSTEDITVVDSTWFTTLIKSDAFKVSGHFRLQPYKDRKELIWINEFEKTGYRREAKKLSYFPENEELI